MELPNVILGEIQQHILKLFISGEGDDVSFCITIAEDKVGCPFTDLREEHSILSIHSLSC